MVVKEMLSYVNHDCVLTTKLNIGKYEDLTYNYRSTFERWQNKGFEKFIKYQTCLTECLIVIRYKVILPQVCVT